MFSIENAERTENCPWKKMILYWKNGHLFCNSRYAKIRSLYLDYLVWAVWEADDELIGNPVIIIDEICMESDGFCIKNDEICMESDGFCIKNDEICMEIDGFCIKNDGFCMTNDGICMKIDGFCMKNGDLNANG